MARNPACVRLHVATVAGVSLAAVARDVYGEQVSERQSPFAINAGTRFEQQLLGNGGAKLFALYREHGRLSASESRVVDVPSFAPGTSPADLTRRRRRSRWPVPRAGWTAPSWSGRSRARRPSASVRTGSSTESSSSHARRS